MYNNKVKNITGLDKIPTELENNGIIINSTNNDIDLADGQAISQGEWTTDLDSILSTLPNLLKQTVLGVYKITDSRFFGENYNPIFIDIWDEISCVLLSWGFRCTGFKKIIEDKLNQFLELNSSSLSLSDTEINEVKNDVLSCISNVPFGFCPVNPTLNAHHMIYRFTNFFSSKDIPVVNINYPYEISAFNGMECIDTILKYEELNIEDPTSEKFTLFSLLLEQLSYINLACVYYNNVSYCVFYLYDSVSNDNGNDVVK